MDIKKIYNRIKEYFAREYINQIDELKSQVNIMDDEIDELLGLIEELGEEEKQEEQESEEALEWNSAFPHATIRYKFQGNYYRDARSLINYPSYIANETVKKYNLKKDTEEETILAILRFCDKKIPYSYDINNYDVNEMWEDSDIILQKMIDDCDGKATVFKALALACGIPDYKVKICAGWVVNPQDRRKRVGHAYPIYLHNGEWYVVDPTYYPDYTPFDKRKIHKDDKNYYPIDNPIWWTFTKQFTFAQHTVDLN